MDLVRTGDAPPAQSLPGMGDHPTAIALYASIVTALLKRERTGRGGRVHTSLLANGLWSASCIAQAGFAGGDYAGYRRVLQTPAFARSLYETRDLRWIQINMIRSQEEVEQLLTAVGLGGLLADERFATPEARAEHGEVLVRLFQDLIRDRDSDEWLELFHREGINASRMSVVEELVHDEQVLVNGMVVPPVDESVKMPHVINHPINVDSLPTVGPKRAPDLGEHTDEILAEMGLNAARIRTLRDKGVI
jgi:formyl-CoA transferase